MEIKDLDVGDVVLFAPEKGSFISWAITYLTSAPVSHAAIYYGDYEGAASIIEETPPAVAINPAKDRFSDRQITVRRLDSDLPSGPVIAAANVYHNNAEPYDKTGLYMVGLMLIYKKFTPGTLVQKVVIKILKKLTATLDEYINKHQHPGKKPMVCSQLVAQCYEDAGAEYKLKFSGNVLMKAAGGSLLDQAMSLVTSDSDRFAKMLLVPEQKMMVAPQETEEQLCKELKEALEAEAPMKMVTVSDELVEAIHQFSQVNTLFLAGETKLSAMALEDVSYSLQLLKENENMFISPGDLLLHCTNLKDVGTIN